MMTVKPTISDKEATELSNAALVDAVETNVWNAAFYARYSHYDANCDALYREAVRRGMEELYDRGYRRAEASCR